MRETYLIKYFDRFTHIEIIDKGFSSDLKFLAVCKSGKKYVLRTAELEKYEAKLKEFEILKEIEKRKIKSSIPVEFGKIEPLNSCYMLVEYIDGEEALEELPKLSIREQYQIGYEAGLDLLKLHTIKAPSSPLSWYDAASAKHERYLKAYRESGIHLEYGEKTSRFINENLVFMKDRPRVLQHDDFHPANLIVLNGEYAGCIDFNRYDYGDPYHDFYKAALFSREVSIPFSVGQINGYFQDEVPAEFWRLYALYAAMSIFSAVVWTNRETPHLMDSMLKRLSLIADDHSAFDQIEPKWFNSFGSIL